MLASFLSQLSARIVHICLIWTYMHPFLHTLLYTIHTYGPRYAMVKRRHVPHTHVPHGPAQESGWPQTPEPCGPWEAVDVFGAKGKPDQVRSNQSMPCRSWLCRTISFRPALSGLGFWLSTVFPISKPTPPSHVDRLHYCVDLRLWIPSSQVSRPWVNDDSRTHNNHGASSPAKSVAEQQRWTKQTPHTCRDNATHKPTLGHTYET
jgi:hypothetical protein